MGEAPIRRGLGTERIYGSLRAKPPAAEETLQWFCFDCCYCCCILFCDLNKPDDDDDDNVKVKI